MKSEEIKVTREALGLTQVEVAVRVGVSISAYRMWEYGGMTPTDEHMKRLQEVFNAEKLHKQAGA